MTMPLDQAPTSLVAMVLLATGTSALPPHEWGVAGTTTFHSQITRWHCLREWASLILSQFLWMNWSELLSGMTKAG
jgi:hypothetical protein